MEPADDDTVIMPRHDFDALLEEIEDLQDRINAIRETEPD